MKVKATELNEGHYLRGEKDSKNCLRVEEVEIKDLSDVEELAETSLVIVHTEFGRCFFTEQDELEIELA